MHIKCPITHVLIKITPELLAAAKTHKLLGINTFTYEAKPIHVNKSYQFMYSDDSVKFRAWYKGKNLWSIRLM